MGLTRTLRPVDYLLIVFNAGFGLLWVSALGRHPDALWMVVAHAGAIWLAVLCGRLGPEASGFGRSAGDLYPIALIAIYWLEMGLVREAFHPSTFDAVIAAADRWPFGRHLQQIWMPAMPQVWFSELMFAAYWVYYPIVFVTPLVLVLRRRAAAGRVVFRTTVAYLACYASYAIFPVDGPSHTMERFVGPHTEGFFYQLVTSAIHAADSMGTAFPSSHVVGVVTMALLATRWFSRPMARLYLLGALGVAVSAVYTQGHFAIDSVAGIAYGVALYAFVSPMLERVLAAREVR